MYPRPRNPTRRAGIQTFALWAAVLLLLGAGATRAGSVDAPALPDAATSAMFTLQGLHQRLLDGSPGTKRGAAFAESARGPGPTINTPDQFMALMPKFDNTDGAAVGNERQGKKFWGLTSGGWGSRSGTLAMQTLSAVSVSQPAGVYAAFDLSAVDSGLVSGNSTAYGGDGGGGKGSAGAAGIDVRPGQPGGSGAEVVRLLPRDVTPSTYSSCAAIRAANGSAGNGNYELSLYGRPVNVYCNDMAGTPKDYLPLVNIGPDQNFAHYYTTSRGKTVTTNYTKLRFDPSTFMVDINDRTFSTSSGSLTHPPSRLVTSMPYATAMDCQAGGSEAGKGNIDLRGTPFKVTSNFSTHGWYPAGSATFSSGDQVVALTGGGNCGYEAPDGLYPMEPQEVSTAQWVLQLALDPKIDQTISVSRNAPSSAPYGRMFDVAASASSTLDVMITVFGVCVKSSGGTSTATIRMTSATGTCSVHYNQPGHDVYGVNPAPEVTNDVEAKQSDTATSITAASPEPSVAGQAYTVSVSVAASGSGSGSPTGTVAVDDGAGVTCPVTLSGGTGSCDLISTASGSRTISAAYLGDDNFLISSTTASHTVTPGAVDASKSTVAATPTSVATDGTTTATITVMLKDAHENAIPGKTVTLGQGIGSSTISAASDASDADGVVTFTVKSSKAEAVTYTATGDSVQITQQAQVTFVPDTPTKYLVTSSNSSPIVGSAVTISAQMADSQGNPVATAGQTVTWSKSDANGSFASATSTTDGNGIATVQFTTHTVAGTATTVMATDGNNYTGSSPPITTVAGAASVTTSTITANPTSITANGNSTSAITVQFKDAHGNNLTTSGGTVTLSSTAGSLGAVSDNANGTYSATLTSATTAGSATVSGMLDAMAITATTSVTFAPGAVDASKSTVTANPTSVAADGTTAASITVTLKDVNENAIPGKTVTLAQGTGSSTISAASGASDADGVVTFTVKNSKAEAVAYSATSDPSGDNVTITQTAQVDFLAAAGTCGAAKGVASLQPPTAGLCDLGTASAVITANGTHSWTCEGIAEGDPDSCSAPGASSGGGGGGGGTVTFETTAGGCTVDSVNVVAPPAGGPTGFTMPYDAITFSLRGCTGNSATVQLTFSGPVEDQEYWKYIDGAWVQMTSGVTLAGSTATLVIEDNGPYDANKTPGIIEDPSGPAQRNGPVPIPTLSTWGLLLTAGVLGFLGTWRHRRPGVVRRA